MKNNSPTTFSRQGFIGIKSAWILGIFIAVASVFAETETSLVTGELGATSDYKRATAKTTGSSGKTVTLFRSGSLSGAFRSEIYFSVTVPPGLKILKIHPRTYPRSRGKARVIMMHEQEPTVSDIYSGNNSGFTAAYPPAGTWYGLVYGESGYQGLGFDIKGVVDPKPFSPVAGRYAQLVNDEDYVSILVSGSGSFTGNLYIRGVRSAFKGKFDIDGDASKVNGTPYSLHLDREPSASGLGANVISGSILGRSISAHHTAYKKGSSAQEAGRYTVMLSPQITSSTVPPGIGYGRISVTKTGGTTFSGRLADGSSHTFSGHVYGSPTGKNQILIYTPKSYRSKGLLCGALTFESSSNSDCNGIVRWIKPVTQTARYPDEIDTHLTAFGNRYGVRSRGLPAVDFPTNIEVRLSGGGLDSDIVEAATYSALNKVLILGSNPSKLKVTINSAQGTFSAAFIHPATNKKVTSKGVLYQNTNSPRAAGYFLGPIVDGSAFGGAITLLP